MDIIKKILTKEEMILLENKLMDCLHDRGWCLGHNISYVNPDIKKARREVYKESFINQQP